MHWKNLFHRETPGTETTEGRVNSLTPTDYFSGPRINELRGTFEKVVKVQKIEKL